MKLVGDVRAVERSFGNGIQGKATPEKRNFKLQVRPASKPDSYYGYGSMNFILHGTELEESGLDLGTKVELYLIPEGGEKPSGSELEDAKRQIYLLQNELDATKLSVEQYKERGAIHERNNMAAGERNRALQAENVRLTVEIMTLKGSAAFAPAPQMIDVQPRS